MVSGAAVQQAGCGFDSRPWTFLFGVSMFSLCGSLKGPLDLFTAHLALDISGQVIRQPAAKSMTVIIVYYTDTSPMLKRKMPLTNDETSC